jgi:hypothetical protein
VTTDVTSDVADATAEASDGRAGATVGVPVGRVDVGAAADASRVLSSDASDPSDTAAARTPPAATTSMPGLQPIDLLGTDGADADVLDDDAFFATLRDAVHDDAPLGPREEDQSSLFDQDDDEAGAFKDVFRRRR